MDDVYKLGLLIDFYGQLLTEKQLEVLELYYNGDYSLAEIASTLDISRQGVYDNLKRGKSALLQFEDKLMLVDKFKKNKVIAENILKLIDEINFDVISLKDKKNLEVVKDGINTIMENV